MSRELLAQEAREIAPILLVAATLVVCLFVGYCIGRAQMARKYSKKNMPEIGRKQLNYLALKLRTTESDRDKLTEENKTLVSRLRGVASLANFRSHFGGGLLQDHWKLTKEQVKDAVPMPKLLGMDVILDESLPENVVILKNLKKKKPINVKRTK